MLVQTEAHARLRPDIPVERHLLVEVVLSLGDEIARGWLLQPAVGCGARCGSKQACCEQTCPRNHHESNGGSNTGCDACCKALRTVEWISDERDQMTRLEAVLKASLTLEYRNGLYRWLARPNWSR